jgi:hypothetical protein
MAEIVKTKRNLKFRKDLNVGAGEESLFEQILVATEAVARK